MVNKRRLLIAGIVLLLGLTAVFTVLAHNSNKPAKKQTTTTTKQAVKVPTAAELSTLLDNDDNPTGNGTFVQYAIFQQGTDDYDRAYGPTDSFPRTRLTTDGVPVAVSNEVPTYDDSQQ
jgi:hypothetical protein